MREYEYQRRLKGDLEKWIAQGIISKINAEEIVKKLPSSQTADRLPSVIAVLGAVLICFGILAFVAANWYGIAKGARLALLAAGMWSAYGGAVVLQARGSLWLYEAAVLVGVGFYAISIVLIAQMYHIDGHYPDAILMAGAGGLVAAWLARSTSALVMAIACITLWTGLEIIEFNVRFHWPFLIAWCVLALSTFHLRSRIGYHLVTLSFGFWATLTVFMSYQLAVGGAVSQLASLAFFVLTISLYFAHHAHKNHPGSFAHPLSYYAVSSLVTLIFLVQAMEAKSYFAVFNTPDAPLFSSVWLGGSAVLVGAGILLSFNWRQKTGYSTTDILGIILLGVTAPVFSIVGVVGLATLILLAICLFLISLWLIIFGQKSSDRYLVNLGFVLFAAETLYIYFKTFGTLMNSFVFFTIGGIVLILLSLGLDRFRKRILKTRVETEAKP